MPACAGSTWGASAAGFKASSRPGPSGPQAAVFDPVNSWGAVVQRAASATDVETRAFWSHE
eukprot:9966095-Alexandrium_andersonii.AAC.1